MFSKITSWAPKTKLLGTTFKDTLSKNVTSRAQIHKYVKVRKPLKMFSEKEYRCSFCGPGSRFLPYNLSINQKV